MKYVYEVFIKKKYSVELNGIAIVGYSIASIYGVIYMIILLIESIQ